MSVWISKGKILTKFGALQVLIQGVTALSGFLIVRLLDKSQYAAYTIAASLQALLMVLSDSGIAWSLNAIGGQIWEDTARLRGLVATSLRLRGYLTAIAIPITVLSGFYLLGRNGVPWQTISALTAGVIATIWGTFLTTIYAAPLRLYSPYGTVQKFALVAACLRLLLIGGLAFVFLNVFCQFFFISIYLLFKEVF